MCQLGRTGVIASYWVVHIERRDVHGLQVFLVDQQNKNWPILLALYLLGHFLKASSIGICLVMPAALAG
jgi:hypothetical protein